jgi:hypothetical protein
VSVAARSWGVTPEAFKELEEAMKRGEIATIGHAHEFLRREGGIQYSLIPTA